MSATNPWPQKTSRGVVSPPGTKTRASGFLVVHVTNATTSGLVASATVRLSGPVNSTASTKANGDAEFPGLTPGRYSVTVRKDAFTDAKTPATVESGRTTTVSVELPPRTAKVGAVLSLHPVLFKKDEAPDRMEDFHVLTDPEFEAFELLADGLSEAVIQVHLVKLTDAGKVAGKELEHATASHHFNEGCVVLELGDSLHGELCYGSQKGSTLRIPLKALSSGTSSLEQGKAVLFRTSREIGTTTLKASITDNSRFEYVRVFALPRTAKAKHALKLGSRNVRRGTKGYDARKLQWYLRRFKFLAYSERKVGDDGPKSAWTHIKDVPLNGDFGPESVRALRDFQRMARGSYRNSSQSHVPVLFQDSAGSNATKPVITELLEWCDRKYEVEPYHGLLQVDHRGGTQLRARAVVLYGALFVDDDPHGYLEVKAPIGESVCHWHADQFVVADALNTAIRLFKRDDLVFRLHDADPGNDLADPHLHADLRSRVSAMLRTLRREQEASCSGQSARDVRIAEGYRTVERQDELYAKGRWTPGVPCDHGEAQKRPVGTCTEHPLGDFVTDALGSSMSSWHQFGAAVDIVFWPEFKGGDPWDASYDWSHLGDAGKTNSLSWGGEWKKKADRPHFQLPSQGSPDKTHKEAYANDTGPLEQRLQTVWNLL
jgi:hypothetical protein